MANQDHLEILKQGFVIWNKWRQDNPTIQPDLSAVDFTDIDLRSDTLDKQSYDNLILNLSNTDLHHANLSNINSQLRKARLRRVELGGADLTDADLSEIDLSLESLVGMNFSWANLTRATFRETDLSHAVFLNAIMYETDLSGAVLRNADLRNTDLRHADMSGVDISEADLSNADLSDADLTNLYQELSSEHRENSMTAATMLKDTKLTGMNLCRANLSGLDLRQVDLGETILDETDLSDTNLEGRNLSGKHIIRTDLSGANLSNADFSGAILEEVDLSHATLSQINLSRAILTNVNLSDADLSKADFSFARIHQSDLSKAYLCETRFFQGDLVGCRIHGISAWDVDLDGTTQKDLIITRVNEPAIIVNNLEVAQFIYLLLSNQKLRQVIDTITSQVVLVVGHFADERKAVLQVLKDELNKRKEQGDYTYSPIIFDLGETSSENFAETLRTLVNMSRFVIIDPTHAGSVLSNIERILAYCRVPIQPLLQDGLLPEYTVLAHLSQKHYWVLPPYRYRDVASLSTTFGGKVTQLEKKGQELRQKKPVKLFFAHAPQDEKIVDKLKTHLHSLEQFGQIEMWDQRRIGPGEKRDEETEIALANAQIILLLISPDFLAAPGFNHIQQRAMERSDSGEAKVIPILLRQCHWQHNTSFGKLKALPRDDFPIIRSKKHDLDEILTEVVGDIIESIKEFS